VNGILNSLTKNADGVFGVLKMIKQIILTMSAFFLCISGSSAQTASELSRKYGEPVINFSVSEHIWMSPSYTADGQVCEARLYSRKFANDANYLGTLLPENELKTVLEQLVPLNARGAKKLPFGQTATGGGAAWTTYAYDNVKLVLVFSFKPKDSGTSTLKPFEFSEGVKPSAETSPGIVNEQFMRAEIVIIEWMNRKCAPKK
jgi:hypothetical protein